jgi:hypothetical protein
VLFQELADLLGVSAAALGSPLRKRSRGVSVVEMRLSTDIKSCDKATDAERSDTTLLGILLFCFGDEFGDVFDRGTVVVVEAVALALDSCFVGQDSSVGCESGVSHVNVIVELHNLFDGSALLQFGDCFFLSGRRCTYAARMTEPWVVRPTAQSPFLTASMAYSTWKRCPLGEKTVMAVSYIPFLKYFQIDISQPIIQSMRKGSLQVFLSKDLDKQLVSYVLQFIFAAFGD